jgi:hypothetical protein
VTYREAPSPAKYQSALQLRGPDQDFLFLSLSSFPLVSSLVERSYKTWRQLGVDCSHVTGSQLQRIENISMEDGQLQVQEPRGRLVSSR